MGICRVIDKNIDKNSKYIIFILSLYLHLFFFSTLARSAAIPVGKIELVEGNVIIQREGKKEPVIAKKGGMVCPGDEVRTERGAKIKISFINHSYISLGEDAHLIITTILYAPKTSLRQSLLKLKQGKIRAVVEKFSHPDSKFEIETKTAVAGVVGTEEIICASMDQETGLDTTRGICKEGRILLRSNDPAIKGEVFLEAMEQSYVLAGNAPAEKLAVTMQELEELIQDTSLSSDREVRDKLTGTTKEDKKEDKKEEKREEKKEDKKEETTKTRETSKEAARDSSKDAHKDTPPATQPAPVQGSTPSSGQEASSSSASPGQEASPSPNPPLLQEPISDKRAEEGEGAQIKEGAIEREEIRDRAETPVESHEVIAPGEQEPPASGTLEPITTETDLPSTEPPSLERDTEVDQSMDNLSEIGDDEDAFQVISDDPLADDPFQNNLEPVIVEDTIHQIEDTIHQSEDTIHQSEDTIHQIEDENPVPVDEPGELPSPPDPPVDR